MTSEPDDVGRAECQQSTLTDKLRGSVGIFNELRAVSDECDNLRAALGELLAASAPYMAREASIREFEALATARAMAIELLKTRKAPA